MDSSTDSNSGASSGFALRNEADDSHQDVTATLSVGRDPGNDLVLDSAKASRSHAVVFLEGGELWVEDQGSTNKTYVNSRPIERKTRLRDGDRVRFADISFTVSAPPPAAPEAAPDATMLASGQTVFQSRPDLERPAASELEAVADSVPSPQDASEQSPGDNSASESPAPPEASSAAVAEPHPSDPSMPRGWADAEGLEQASKTAFVARGDFAAAAADSTNPYRAIARARQSVEPQQPILVGLSQPVSGRVFELHRQKGTDKWELGRDQGADIVIDDESVSGRHAQLVCEQGRWKVVNMMAINGTFVNDRKVLSAYLNPHDRIRMGTVEFVFDAPAKSQGAPQRDPAPLARSGWRGWPGRMVAALGRLFRRN